MAFRAKPFTGVKNSIAIRQSNEWARAPHVRQLGHGVRNIASEKYPFFETVQLES